MTFPLGLVFPKLDSPVPVEPAEAFVAPRILDDAHGAAEAKKAILGSLFRPTDIEQAEIDGARFMYVPFWRIDVGVDGFHIGLTRVTIGNGRTQLPLPTGGARHKDAVLMVCARRLFPYELKVPSWLSGLASQVEPFAVNPGELALRSTVTMTEEVVDADVTRIDAERDAARVMLRLVQPSSALYAKYEPVIRSTTFCHYPVFYVRYQYEGEARRHPGENLFVVVSARTGKPIAARHPSAMRAAAAKFRRLLTWG
jgi:hypothetical protein